MKRPAGLFAGLLTATVLAAAVTPSAGAAPATAHRDKVLSKPELRAALLTVKDLPKGFKLDKKSGKKSHDGDDVQLASKDPDCQQSLEIDGPKHSPGQLSEAETDFERDLDFSFESASVDIAAFRNSASVVKDFAIIEPLIRACHKLSMEMGDGTKMWFSVQSSMRRINSNRTFVMSLRGRYMGVLMNLVQATSQVHNYEVTTVLMGVNKSAASVTKLTRNLLRAQTVKLEKHLH